MTNIIPLLRLSVFGVSLLFSIIVLGLDAYVVSKYSSNSIYSNSSPPASNSLGVANAVLTLVSLGPLLATDFLRQGAMVSMVLIDLIVGFILWILWLTAGAYTASQWNFSCTQSDLFYSDTIIGCGEAKAAAGFAFLIFFALLGYWVTLLVFSIIAMSNGNRNIWTTPINEANFDEKSPQNFNAPSNHLYPPQQQNLMQSSHVPTAPQYQG